MIHVVTVASHIGGQMPAFLASAEKFGIGVDIHLTGEPYPGHLAKLKAVYAVLEGMGSREIVLFADAWDSVFVRPLEGMVESFRGFGHPFVMSAETFCAPLFDRDKDYPACTTRYCYLNSGLYMGEAGAIQAVFEELKLFRLPDGLNDQGVLTDYYLANPGRIQLDHHCQLFQNLFQAERDIEFTHAGVVNRLTGGRPFLVHGNGRAEMSETVHWLN